MEQDLFMTRLYLFENLSRLFFNICIKFDTWKENWKQSVLEENNVILNEKHYW